MRVILSAYNRNQALRSESDQLDDWVENQPSPSHTSENFIEDEEGAEEIVASENSSPPAEVLPATSLKEVATAPVVRAPTEKSCDQPLAELSNNCNNELERKLPAAKSEITTRKRKLPQGFPVESETSLKKPPAIDPIDSKKPAAKMTAGRYRDEEREAPPPPDENTISMVQKNDPALCNDSPASVPFQDGFAKNLKKRGLEIREQEGDGNCLFRAVSLQVYGDPNMHMDVRRQSLDHMAKDEAHFAHFVEDEDFGAYIQRKRQEGVHGNNPEIQAISELFNRPVEVFTPDNGAAPLNIFQSDYKTSDVPIRLSYADNHYDAVVDPLLPTAGLGLGLPGLQPGLADKMQMDKAVRESDQLADRAELKKAMEDSHNDQLQRAIKESSLSNDQMYSNKAMALSDLEATNLDIEQAILESSLDAFRQQESGRKQGAAVRRSRSEPSAVLSSAVAKIPPVAAALPVAAAAPPVASVAAAASVPMMMQPAMAASASRTIPSTDEYPPTVQELVMNGFELSKVVHAYELIGDDFDNLLSFLVSTSAP